MHPRHLLCWSLLLSVGCVAAGEHDGDPESPASTPTALRLESAECEHFVGAPKDPGKMSRQYRELLAATSGDDPAVPTILVSLARSDLATGSTGTACRALAMAAERDDDGDAGKQADEGLHACCDELAVSAAALPTAKAPRCDGGVEVACERGEAPCCMAATIREEYELLEARAHGDDEAARAHEERLRVLLQRACDGGMADACTTE